MGLETKCQIDLGQGAFAGTAHLDSENLTIRGAGKISVPLKSVVRAEVGRGGRLEVKHAHGLLRLELGDRATAEKWMLKIRYPRSLIDKLGVKADSRVVVLGVDDPVFATELQQRLGRKPEGRAASDLDLIFYAADSARELERLGELRRALQPAGAIWVVSLKGRQATIRDVDVIKAARAAGLVDNKVCGFSATHTALRLVIPLAQRKS